MYVYCYYYFFNICICYLAWFLYFGLYKIKLNTISEVKTKTEWMFENFIERIWSSRARPRFPERARTVIQTLQLLRTIRQYVLEPARKCSPVLLDFEGAQDFAVK